MREEERGKESEKNSSGKQESRVKKREKRGRGG
jgi:hypothetical protein